MLSLGERIKGYERASAHQLTPNSSVIIRVDGRAFHTYTRGMNRPFDQHLMDSMVLAAEQTAAEMQGFKLGYTQSDEATFLLTDFDRHDTLGWFGYDLSKLISISASLFTMYFNRRHIVKQTAVFDSRAFVVPELDVPNTFVWRQKDWERNSLQMLARSHFSHKELLGKNRTQMHDMLHRVGVNWATDLTAQQKNGTFVLRDGTIHHLVWAYEDIRAELDRQMPVEVPA